MEITSIQKFESISEIVRTNKPIIKDSLDKAIAVAKTILKVETEQDDEMANNFLAKGNVTITKCTALRKEYTGILDAWKKGEMELEKDLTAEMDRIRALRNARATRLADENNKKRAEIEKQKSKDKEIARIKAEMVAAVDLGVATRINQGEQAIAKMFAEMTLENYEATVKKLDFKPQLKEELFRGFIAVDYDQNIIPYEEFKAIVDAAYKHFDYDRSNKAYVAAVLKVVTTWKAKLPAKRAELEAIAKANGEQAERLRKEAQEKANKAAQDLRESMEVKEDAIKKKAQGLQSEAVLNAEFEGQIALQQIQDQTGTRGVISFRLANEDKIMSTPVKLVEVMGRIMINVLADPEFKGIFKRQTGGFPKRDEKGNAVYIDAIQEWLDLLAKVKPVADFDGVIMTEDQTTIAKVR